MILVSDTTVARPRVRNRRARGILAIRYSALVRPTFTLVVLAVRALARALGEDRCRVGHGSHSRCISIISGRARFYTV